MDFKYCTSEEQYPIKDIETELTQIHEEVIVEELSMETTLILRRGCLILYCLCC